MRRGQPYGALASTTGAHDRLLGRPTGTSLRLWLRTSRRGVTAVRATLPRGAGDRALILRPRSA